MSSCCRSAARLWRDSSSLGCRAAMRTHRHRADALHTHPEKNVCSLAQDSLKYAEKVLQRITMGRYCISRDDARGRTGVLPIQWNPIQRIPNAHA